MRYTDEKFHLLLIFTEPAAAINTRPVIICPGENTRVGLSKIICKFCTPIVISNRY